MRVRTVLNEGINVQGFFFLFASKPKIVKEYFYYDVRSFNTCQFGRAHELHVMNECFVK